MDNSTLQTIRDFIGKNDQIGIVVGKDLNLDVMAGALSLYLFLTDQNKKVSIASPTEPIVEVSSLVGIDKVKTNLEGDGGDLVVSFPYKDDEIQKVSYTLENNFLNIIVKAGEAGLSFDEKQVQFKRGGAASTLLFIIGTSKLSDLGHLFNTDELKDTKIINIDNKTHNQGFGDVVFVAPKFSSVSEQMAQLLVFLEANVDVDIAQNLLSGISSATNNFQSPKTSYVAFEMAGYLIKKGAVRPKTDSQVSPNTDETFFPSFKTNTLSQGQQGTFPKLNRPQQQQQNRFHQRPQQNQFQQQPNQPASQPVQRTPSQPQQLGQFTGYPQAAKQTRGGKEDEQEAPPDWLTPKVYKSSNLG